MNIIIDPLTNQKFSIFSSYGKRILKHYIKSLYIGFIPNWLRLAPWQFIFWNSYEFYRIKFGLDGF